MKYSSWWGLRPRKITNFLRWREFHCLAAPWLIWLVETVSFRPSKSIVSVGHLACRTVVWKSGIFGTFWLIVLDPDNRLRYPPVSLLRDMCWWFWLGRGVPEKLFEAKFGKVKVRCKIRNFEIFMNSGWWWLFRCPKMTQFPLWREFQCLAAPLW